MEQLLPVPRPKLIPGVGILCADGFFRNNCACLIFDEDIRNTVGGEDWYESIEFGPDGFVSATGGSDPTKDGELTQPQLAMPYRVQERFVSAARQLGRTLHVSLSRSEVGTDLEVNGDDLAETYTDSFEMISKALGAT